MKYKIGKYTLDIEATRAMYAAKPDSEVKNSKDLNFLRFLSSNERAMPFFLTLGIDPRKAVPSFVTDADPAKQIVSYCGKFRVCGTTDAPIDDMEWHEGCEDEYIKTDFGFVLGIFHTSEELSLYFEGDIPWLLSKPILPTRHVNHHIYPDLADVI